MQGIHLRKYGVETKIPFELYEVDGVDLRVDAVDAGSDCTIMKDEGAEATCTNDFVDEGMGYSITLTPTEMEAARIVVYVVDSATKVWLDKVIVIETYGHASAQHALDLDTAIDAAGTAATPAEVNAEVVDALNVDTYAEPGQEAPAATTTLVKKIGYLYKFLRNKVTNDGTNIKVYNDAGAVVDQKNTVSEAAGTVTRGEFGTGL